MVKCLQQQEIVMTNWRNTAKGQARIARGYAAKAVCGNSGALIAAAKKEIELRDKYAQHRAYEAEMCADAGTFAVYGE